MKRGVTLLEMLIVIGILSILTGVAVSGYSHVVRKGEQARARELVSNVATALTALFEREGVWPKAIRESSDHKLNEKIAWYLRKDLSVSVASDAKLDTTADGKRVTIGYDRFGIVTPWALAVIKRQGSSATEGSKVVGDSTIDDHILRFAVDLDGDGIIENAPVGGVGKKTRSSGVTMRATAAVWCCNSKGVIEEYAEGVKRDGVYSWTYGQTQQVK